MITIDEVREQFERNEELATFHPLAIKIMNMVEDPDVSIVELEKVIEKDPVIAAEVIRVANSPLYMPSQQIKSLRYAISYLGMAVVRSIVIVTALRSVYKKVKNTEVASYLWKHSLISATFARELTTSVLSNKLNKEITFLITLVHDIGKIALLNFYTDLYQRVFVEVKNGGQFFTAEREIIGVDHCEVGALLLGRWLFPVEFVETVAKHHEEPFDDYTAIILLSNLFSSSMTDVLINPIGYMAYKDRALEILGVDSYIFSQVVDSAKKKLEKSGDLLSV
ncbi:MAG: HDOD domain-containing protein [Thermosulfidibacteraceae bacterium]|jgi:putative nucleotidyltransferase with HDIG domain